MKRKQKHPVRVIESPRPVTHGSAPVHPPYWHYEPEIAEVYPRGSCALAGGTIVFLGVLLLILPAYGLTLLFITLVEAIHGAPLTYVQMLTDPVYLLPVLGLPLLFAVLLSVVTTGPRIIAFHFDETTQLLTFTQTRRFGKAIEMRVPFSDILWIAPYVMSSLDLSGHFQISLGRPKGKALRLGPDFPLSEMEFHVVWLQGLIGSRMADICNLDQ